MLPSCSAEINGSQSIWMDAPPVPLKGQRVLMAVEDDKCRQFNRTATVTDQYGAMMEAAVERVRPRMMTVVAIMAGLLPIMWGTGTGSEMMSRIAAPMVGCMISSTVLTLAVIPAIYALVKQWRLKRGMEG